MAIFSFRRGRVSALTVSSLSKPLLRLPQQCQLDAQAREELRFSGKTSDRCARLVSKHFSRGNHERVLKSGLTAFIFFV